MFKPPPELHFEGMPSKDLSSALFTACALNRPVSLENCFVANYEQTENGDYKFTLLLKKQQYIMLKNLKNLQK